MISGPIPSPWATVMAVAPGMAGVENSAGAASVVVKFGLAPFALTNIRHFFRVLQYVFSVSYDKKVPAESWTFLTNYSHVLLCVAAEPEILMREVAARVGITERAAQRIVADLIEAGYLKSEKIGRRNRYRIHADLPLRHPVEQRNPVSALLALSRPDGSGPFARTERTRGIRPGTSTQRVRLP